MLVKELLEEYPDYETEYYYADSYILRTKRLSDIVRIGAENFEYIDETVNPYSLVECYKLMDKEDYSWFTQIDEEYIDNEVLVIIVAKENGIMPDRKIWEDAEKGKVSNETLSEVCYTFSKLAKIYRHNRALLNSYCYLDFKNGEDREEKKSEYYDKKDIILDRYEPKEIHYDTSINQVYLYYEFGNHSFHHPVGAYDDINEIYNDLKEMGIEDVKNLEIKELTAFESDECSVEKLWNERFCDFVLEQIFSP